jgi:DNA-directed RNA polymerase subunit RPC12/RpoP
MTSDSMVSELTAYFAQGKYPEPVLRRMRAVIESIAEGERDTVLEHLIENQKASFKIGVSDIVESCKSLGVGFRAAKYVPAMDWTCVACGHSFKFTLCPTDDDKIDKNLHDVCPMCGFQPYWTILHDQYLEGGLECGWYDGLITEARAFGPRAAPSIKRIFDLTLHRGGVFWNKPMAEAERRENRKMKIDARMAALDRAKRWDLEGGDNGQE